MSERHDHDADAQDVPRDEDGLRVVPEGYDPQQVHELLAGYKEQMDRLEQVLGSVQAALGVTGEEGERVPGEEIDPPDARALQLAADYRPSTMRFDPGPISSRVAPGAPLPVRPRSRNTGLLTRMALEGAFIVLVILALAVLQQPARVILLGAIGAWLGVILVVEVLLARIHARIAAPATEAVVAPPAARPDVVALRLPHPPPPAPEPAAQPEPEPVDAVTGPDDVWVVPQEVLIAEAVFEDFAPAEPVVAGPVLEDTLETDAEIDEAAEAAVAGEEDVDAEVVAEVEGDAADEVEDEVAPQPVGPEPDAEPAAAVEPELEPEPVAIDAEAEADVLEPELEPEPVATEAEADVLEPEAEPEPLAALEPEAEPAPEPEPEPEAEAEPEAAGIEPQTVAAASEAEHTAEPDAATDAEPEPAAGEWRADHEADAKAAAADDVGWGALEAAVHAGRADEPEQLALAPDDADDADEPDIPTAEDAAPAAEADAVPSLPRPERPISVEWPEAPLSTDSWEPLFEPEPVVEAPSARRWPFARRAPEPAARRGLLAPPDPELTRSAQPLPPVLIDPLADGTANGKRRSRRRRS